MKSDISMQPQRARGFTLLELLMVVAIMGIIMMMSVAAFIDIGRGAAMKATVLDLRASMSHARQYAVTRRAKTYFLYGNTGWNERITGYYFFATNRDSSGATNFSVVGITNFTADGILFGTTNNLTPPIIFDTDGSCVDENDGIWGNSGNYKRSIELFEALRDGTRRPPTKGGLATTTEVYRLTGRIKGSGWVNE